MRVAHSLTAIPPLDGLQAVLAAAQHGSFTGAAEAIGVTHGAISRRVATTEAWLGTSIFERHGRGVRLTPAGQRFAREIAQALAAIGQTSERWRPRHGRVTLRLGLVPSFAKLWLLPRLKGLMDTLPGIRVELLVDHRTVDLQANEADVVIRYGKGNWPGLRAKLLFDETLVPVASPAMARQLRERSDPEMLLDCPLIHDSDTSQWRAWFAERRVRFSPRVHDHRFEDYDLVLAAAEGSIGLALLRLPLAQDWLSSGKLVVISPHALPNPKGHWIAHRNDEERDGVLTFVDSVLEEVTFSKRPTANPGLPIGG